MGYEIDFLPVGDGSKSGDAIALRYGNLASGDPNQQMVIVIDGGYTDDGEALVELIKTHYNTDYVDVVVSTHPDQVTSPDWKLSWHNFVSDNYGCTSPGSIPKHSRHHALRAFGLAT
jgi:hypothetical protein